MTARTRRRKVARQLAWLVVLGLAATALVLPSTTTAAPLPGAIWTSLSNGATVNANHYANKTDVYLNGGPQNCSGGGLPDGLYYFQVTDPSGATLLSSDAISNRMVEVVTGLISGVGGTGTHAEGSGTCSGGVPVQLSPFADTPNQGGEYKAWLSPEAAVEECTGFSPTSTTFNFKDCGESKTDNFKVGEVVTPTQSPTPTDPPTATPTGSVGGATATAPATATPARTLPTTSTIDGSDGPLNDGWRIILLGLAAVLAAGLLLTPASAVVRKDDASR